MCTIGRRESNTIVLTSQKFRKLVSRRHAKLVWLEPERRWKIVDLDSTNGVLVNHIKVADAPLKEGSRPPRSIPARQREPVLLHIVVQYARFLHVHL